SAYSEEQSALTERQKSTRFSSHPLSGRRSHLGHNRKQPISNRASAQRRKPSIVARDRRRARIQVGKSEGAETAARLILGKVLLRRHQVGPHVIGAARERDELLVVILGLCPITRPFGGLCGACKRAIAIRIVAKRHLEFLQR